LRFSGKSSQKKSAQFQDEFPELAGGVDENVAPSKKEIKEVQYGPGPSLRPQSKCTVRPYMFVTMAYIYI